MDHRVSLVLVSGFWQVFGVRITDCINGKVTIYEDRPSPVTCEDIEDISDAVWRRGEGLLVGVCDADGICNNYSPNDYRLSRSPQSTESQLTLVPDYRRHVGLTVTCQDQQNYAFATCTIAIIPSSRSPVTNSSSSVLPATGSSLKGSKLVATITGSIIGFIVIVAGIVLFIVLRRRRLQRISSEESLPSVGSTTNPSSRRLPAIPPSIPPFIRKGQRTDMNTGTVYEEPIPLAEQSRGLSEHTYEQPVPQKQEDDIYIELDITDSATT